jgi:predicted DNA-binding protein with PD1-like motif
LLWKEEKEKPTRHFTFEGYNKNATSPYPPLECNNFYTRCASQFNLKTQEVLMMQFTEAKLGRAFVLRLHDGDRLPDVIETFAEDNKVSAAMCFFLGGAKENSRVVVGPKDCYTLPPEPMVTLLEGIHEACGVGTIFTDETGKPKLHMHTSFGRSENTITGCVRMGVEVWQIGEVVILELASAKAARVKNKETDFEFLEIQ